jgi:hypothetical protein
MKKTFSLVMVLAIFTPVVAFAANGQPFVALQKQANELQSRTEALQAQIDYFDSLFHPVLRQVTVELEDGMPVELYARCADDEIVISGGVQTSVVPNWGFNIYINKPCANLTCWEVLVSSFDLPNSVSVYALCVKK